jgi:hypothetical protein
MKTSKLQVCDSCDLLCIPTKKVLTIDTATIWQTYDILCRDCFDECQFGERTAATLDECMNDTDWGFDELG